MEHLSFLVKALERADMTVLHLRTVMGWRPSPGRESRKAVAIGWLGFDTDSFRTFLWLLGWLMSIYRELFACQIEGFSSTHSGNYPSIH